jgi:hypothetical protein
MASVKICPACKGHNLSNALFCKECKTPLSRISPSKLEEEISPTLKEASEIDEVPGQGKLCSNQDCNELLIEGKAYCVYCNTAVENECLSKTRQPKVGKAGIRLTPNNYFFEITDRILVGRDESLSPVACHIPQSFDNISRRHAELWIENGIMYVKDLSSTNGTFVNGQQVPAGTNRLIQAGDEIRFAAHYTVKVEMCDD